MFSFDLNNEALFDDARVWCVLMAAHDALCSSKLRDEGNVSLNDLLEAVSACAIRHLHCSVSASNQVLFPMLK